MSDTSDETPILLDYTSRDFSAIRAQLIGLAKGLMPEWQTVGENADFGTLLLELFAYMGDVMNFYIDRASSEAFLASALRRQSVLYIADMLGYKPVGQGAASVELLFTLDEESLEAELVLPAGTRVHNEGDDDNIIVFELDSDVTLRKSSDYGNPTFDYINWDDTTQKVIGYATEGVSVNNYPLGISLGAPTAEFVLPEKGIVYNSVKVTTREAGSVVEWSEITNIALARPTQSAFTTYIDDLDQTHILFGDNAAGRIPPVDAEIFCSYRVGVGSSANSLSPGDISVIVPPTDMADTIWAVSVSNSSAPVGGTDVESADTMRASIPRSNRIKQRAITLTDYADLALQVPSVAKSTAYGSVYSAVYVRIAPVAGEATASFMNRLITDVESYMEDKILVGSSVNVEPSDLADLWQELYIRAMVYVQPAYNRHQVRDEVARRIREVLAFDSVDFGTRVSKGLIYRTMLSVNGVEWAELEHLSGTPPDANADNEGPETNLVVEEIGVGETGYPDHAIKVPRIEPTEVVENTTDFPETFLADEEDRTHNGLWVKAQGGLANT